MASVFLIGGARSGKSFLAQKLAGKAGRAHGLGVTTVVTAEALDAEMADRILRHKQERPANWDVVEAPLHLADGIASVGPADVLLLDCITLWLSNRIVRGDSAAAVEKSARAVTIGLSARTGPTIVVSNEVGLGIVPDNRMGREFRDLQGRVNRMIADELDRSYFVVAGRLLRVNDEGRAEAEEFLL